MTTRYYRIHSADEQPESILRPERHVSRVWVGEVYRRCTADGCVRGTVEEFGGYDDDGTPEIFASDCDVCGGSGEVEDVRRGVSCCTSLESLRAYFADRGADTAGDVVIEIEGTPSEDDDWDVADGAVLVIPTRIISVRPASEVL